MRSAITSIIALIALAALVVYNFYFVPLGKKPGTLGRPPVVVPSNAAPLAYKRVLVVGIGIDLYENGRIPSTKYSENDANNLTTRLKVDYGYDSLTLIGKAATREAIQQTLAEQGKALGPDEALIVFFAGHGKVVEDRKTGAREGFLLPYDARVDLDEKDLAKWKESTLNMREMKDLAASYNSRHVLFIVDACCSGFMTGRGFEERTDLARLLIDRSRCVMAATSANETAIGDEVKKQGLFTSAFLDSLNKKEAQGITELFHETRRKIMAKSSHPMTPQMNGTGFGEFVFVPLSQSRADVEAVLNEARQIVAGRTPDKQKDLQRGGPFQSIFKSAIDRAKNQTTLDDLIEAYDAPDYRLGTFVRDKQSLWENKFRLLQENAAAGNTFAMASLVYCYHKGLGIDRDEDAAFRSAKLARNWNACRPPCLWLLSLSQNRHKRRESCRSGARSPLGCPTRLSSFESLGRNQQGRTKGY